MKRKKIKHWLVRKSRGRVFVKGKKDLAKRRKISKWAIQKCSYISICKILFLNLIDPPTLEIENSGENMIPGQRTMLRKGKLTSELMDLKVKYQGCT